MDSGVCVFCVERGHPEGEVGWQGGDAAVGMGAEIQGCQACPLSQYFQAPHHSVIALEVA